ncbi:hypothetical protein BJY04DRAFT_184878 [Aspergillus karnatakaensis]|uniref:GMC family oxidoreductase n=1 Tax=Aspergillus karnatakaensis TaxID=1810916 RepID=UPI003CCE2660
MSGWIVRGKLHDIPAVCPRFVYLRRSPNNTDRPTRQSLDRWAKVANDTTYSFDQVLPYYQRSARFTPPNVTQRLPNATTSYHESAFDPAGGPLDVSYTNFVMPFSTWMERALQEIGIQEATDFNSGNLSGYQYCSSTIRPRDQSRSSSESSFLQQTLSPNLRVYTKTLAKRILFDEVNNAVAVDIGSRSLQARKEVILSAGAFQSPQLLMVSGIGPREHLKEHGIPVLVDLPGVGQGMLDHPFFAPSYRVNLETLTRVATHPMYLAEEYLRWATRSEGIFANPAAHFLGWEKISDGYRRGFSLATERDLSWFTEDWPEVEYISGAGFIGNVSNLLKDQPRDGHEYASILGVLIATTSQGTITLASSDTSDPPIINPNWLDTESDQQLAVALLKRIRHAFQCEQINTILIGEEYFPGDAVQTDEEILEYIRENIMTIWHPSRTCRMGTADDPMAVVDSKARVFGVNRLRVVDASAFPFLPPGILSPHAICLLRRLRRIFCSPMETRVKTQ